MELVPMKTPAGALVPVDNEKVKTALDKMRKLIRG